MSALPNPSEQALLALWDFIDAVRLKQSEPHAAIIARRALEAATKETRLNARLKQLTAQRGMEAYKVQALVDLYDGDEAWVEQIILGADTAQKAALSAGIAYKATDEGGDEYPPELLDAIEAAYEQLGDWDAITDAVQALAQPLAKARVLTDSGRQSSFPTAAKAFDARRDPYAVAAGADQAQRGRAPVVTKSTPTTMKSLIESGLNSLGDLH